MPTVAAPPLTFLYPMQPSPLLAWPNLASGEWVAQPKVDGWHIVILPDGRVFTRHGKELTAWTGLTRIVSTIRRHPPRYPLDGELTVKDQPRTAIPGLSHRMDLIPLIYVFDLIVEGVPFEERITVAVKETPRSPVFRVLTPAPVYDLGQARELLKTWKILGYEGMVLKKRSGLYQPGKVSPIVSPDMIKVK